MTLDLSTSVRSILLAIGMVCTAGLQLCGQKPGATSPAPASASQPAKTVFELVLETLECKSTEDSTGADEAKLVLKVDGGEGKTWRRDMNDGQILEIHERYRFESKATLVLWDLDTGFIDKDDKLGTVDIKAEPTDRTTRSFKKDGANYVLTYSVRALAAGNPVPEAVPARRLVIHSIKCRKQEDFFGADDVELRPVVDGGRRSAWRKKMNTGDRWDIAAELPFEAEVRLQLFELDNDADDHLGSIRVTADEVPHGLRTLTLDRDEARYEVVVELVGTKRTDGMHGEAEFARFRESGRAGKYTKLAKEEILKQLAARLHNPTMMQQADAPLCGPMAALVALVQKYPARYVAMAQSLYETGRYRIGNLVIEPDDHLYTSRAKQGVGALDWMLAASMRDSANLTWDFEGTGSWLDDVAGATTPTQMEVWLRGLLGCKTEYLGTRLYGEQEAMKRARNALEAGNVVVLFVDSDYFADKGGAFTVKRSDTDGIWNQNIFEDHVVLLQEVYEVGKHTRFRVFTWGGLWDVECKEGRLEDLVFGAVIGWF